MQNQKSKILIIITVVVIIVTVLSVYTSAKSLDVTTEHITLLQMYGSNNPEATSNAWRSYGYNIISDSEIVSNDIVYTQTRQMLTLSYPRIYTETITIQFDVQVELYSTNDYTNISDNSVAKIEIYTPYKSINMIKTQISNKKIRYTLNATDINQNTERIVLFTNISAVSFRFHYTNISIKINDETYKIVTELNNVSSDINSALANDILPEYNESDLPSIINNQYIIHDETISNWFTQSIYDLEIVKIVVFAGLAFAFMGFLLYGKKG